MIETFGERVERLREERGLDHHQLAVKVGLKEGAVRHWETGHTKQASFSNGLLLARALGVSPWYLAFGKDEPGANAPIAAELGDVRLPEREAPEFLELAREVQQLREEMTLLLSERRAPQAELATPQKPRRPS